MAQGQTTQTSWHEIEAECGDYRAGFVAVFRKYEGQQTDEKTKQGHVVKVTIASFARHMKIDKATFGDWVRRETSGASRHVGRDRTRENIQRMPAEQKAQLAKEIIKDLPDEERQDIIGMRPRPPELSEAERKAREAAADRLTKPLGDAVASFSALGVIGHLEQALEELRDTDGALSEEMTAKVTALLEEIDHEMQVHQFRAEVNS